MQLLPIAAPSEGTGLIKLGLVHAEARDEDTLAAHNSRALLVVSSVAVYADSHTASARNALRRGAGLAAGPVRTVGAFSCPLGDVFAACHCPAQPSLLAVKFDAVLALYDLSAAYQAIREDAEQEVADSDSSSDSQGSGAASDATDACEDERASGSGGDGGGASTSSSGSSGGGGGVSAPAHVCADPEQRSGSGLAWGASGSGEARLHSSVAGGGVREHALRPDGSLAVLTTRRGGGAAGGGGGGFWHEPTAEVADLAWWGGLGSSGDGGEASCSGAGAGGGGLLASAGSDGRVVLWDARQAGAAGALPRSPRDVNAVSFAPASGSGGGGRGGGGGGEGRGGAETGPPSAKRQRTAGGDAAAGGGGASAPLLAAAGDEGLLRVYDLRWLGGGRQGGGGEGGRAGGGAAALHRFKEHMCGGAGPSWGQGLQLLLARESLGWHAEGRHRRAGASARCRGQHHCLRPGRRPHEHGQRVPPCAVQVRRAARGLQPAHAPAAGVVGCEPRSARTQVGSRC